MGEFTLKILWKLIKMYKLLVCSFLAMAAAAPIEDTPEVAEAKAKFQAAFDAAAAGGLAAKQAPAPVHVIPEPAPLAVAPAPVVAAAPVLATHPYAAGFPIHGLGYAGIPYAAGLVH